MAAERRIKVYRQDVKRVVTEIDLSRTPKTNCSRDPATIVTNDSSPANVTVTATLPPDVDEEWYGRRQRRAGSRNCTCRTAPAAALVSRLARRTRVHVRKGGSPILVQKEVVQNQGQGTSLQREHELS